MLSNSHILKDAPEDPALNVLALIDEVIRLSGRLLTARKMTSEVAGIRTSHWLVLTAVCRASTPVTVARIARSFGHSRQAVQRIADALAADGMIRFVATPADRRTKLLVPTGAGEAAFAIADREGLEWSRRLVDGIDPAAIDAAASLLSGLRGRIERQEREQGSGR